MGCWDETCALTQTAVSYNDPCVMVELEDCGHPEIIHDGKVIAPATPFTSINAAHPEYLYASENYRYHGIKLRRVGYGLYSEYGDLDTMERDDSSKMFRYFFHRAAWDWALSYAKRHGIVYEDRHSAFRKLAEIVGRPEDVPAWLPPVLSKDFQDFMVVDTVAFYIRRPLATPPSGHQSACDSRPAQKEWHHLVGILLNKS